MFQGTRLGLSFGILLILVQCHLKPCSAGTSPATKLISGIWTEEGCIVPHEDKSRKIWGVATLWLSEDPVEPCNSPCGCPPEGLNPPYVVKPSYNVSTPITAKLPLLVEISQPPISRLPIAPPLVPPPKVIPGGFPADCFVPGIGFLNLTQPRFPVPVAPVPPFIGPRPVPPFVPPFIFSPIPPPVAPPYFTPLPPFPPHFIGPLPPPLPVLPPRIPQYPTPPIVKPTLDKVPIDFGFRPVPPTKPAVVAPIVAPPQVGIATGSTTVTQEDWDKEKFNANYDKDTGSKHTVTTTGGNVGVVAPPPCKISPAVPPQVISTASTTSVTQEDWNKEKFNATYDKDHGSKHTVTTTGGTPAFVAAPAPCLCASGIRPTFGGVVGGGATTVTQEDWDKQNMNLNYDKDHGSRTNFTTVGAGMGLTYPNLYLPPPPLYGALPPGVSHVDVGLLMPPVPLPQGPFAAIIPPLPQHPPHVGTVASSAITQEDWDKEKFNANYNKDTGSKHTVTTTGGSAALVAAPEPCVCATGTRLPVPPPQHIAPIVAPPPQYPHPFPTHHVFPPPIPPQHVFPPFMHVVGSPLKPVMDHVILDFGDNPEAVKPDLPPSPTPAPCSLPSPPTANLTQPATPGVFPSFISKIPIVGSLLKPYLEPVAVNVGDTPVTYPSSGNPHGPPFTTVPIQFGTVSLPQPIYPQYPPIPAGPWVPPSSFPPVNVPAHILPSPPVSGVYLPSPPSVLPAGVPDDVRVPSFSTVPASVPYPSHISGVYAPPPSVTEIRPPPSLGLQPTGPPPSLGPQPSNPPPIIELGPPPSLGPSPQGPPPDYDFLPKDPSYIVRPPILHVEDPGLVVSSGNRNVLVNRYGGGLGVIRPRPASVQPVKCPLGNGRCGRDVKDLKSDEVITPENHLRSTEKEAAVVTQVVSEEIRTPPAEETLPLASNILTALQDK